MNYRDEVIRNCPTFAADTLEKKLSLAGLGLAGEAGELLEALESPDDPRRNSDRILLEAGDVYWYLEYLSATLNVDQEFCVVASATPYPVVKAARGEHIAIQASIAAASIADNIKKVLHHSVALDGKRASIVCSMGKLYRLLEGLGREMGKTPEEVMQLNVDKLRKRHPNGWTPASQQAKADEKVTA